MGIYTCNASNNAGSVTSSAELKVNGRVEREGRVSRKTMKKTDKETERFASCFSEPPDLIPITFGREVFSEGDSAQTVCSIAKGDDPIKISWSFHGHSISNDQGIVITNFGTRTSILVIASVDHQHRGNYTCQASNKAGHISSTTALKVNG